LPGEEPLAVTDPLAATTDLLESLAGATLATPPAGAEALQPARRSARKTVGSVDGESRSDAPALSPLAVAVRAADLRPAATRGSAVVVSTGAAGDGDSAPIAGPARAAQDGGRVGAPVDAAAQLDPRAQRFALASSDAVAGAPGRAEPTGMAGSPPDPRLPSPPPTSFAAVPAAQGPQSEGEGQAVPRAAVRSDPQGLSAAWAAVDDVRLAAFARRGADGPAGAPLEVDVPVGSRGWERALGERVVWLVGQQIQAAEIKLNPPHLGPVEVRLTLSGSEASLSFGTPHAPVREAIEHALPRLREQLAEQNLVLVNVDVGDRGVFGQAAGRQEPRPFATAPAAAPDVPDPRRESPAGTHRPAIGLVDEYA
jgi:flagellar hook-length control protein FliK